MTSVTLVPRVHRLVACHARLHVVNHLGADHVAFLHLEGTKVKDLTPLAAWKSLGVVIVADDTSPALLAALKKAKPSLRAITAHQAALAAQGPH